MSHTQMKNFLLQLILYNFNFQLKSQASKLKYFLNDGNTQEEKVNQKQKTEKNKKKPT